MAPPSSPPDQARFFFEMDSLIPSEFVGYARFLLSTIAGYEAGESRRGPAAGLQGVLQGRLAPEPGQLPGAPDRPPGKATGNVLVAIMTDGDPDMGYGIDTIQGTTRALLR